MGRLQLLIVLVTVSYAIAFDCKIDSPPAKQKDFPNVQAKGKESYQMSVISTLSNKEVQETNYFTEYYDILNKIGRVDVLSKMKSISYFYYTETDEAFEVSGESCGSFNFTVHVPEFLKKLVTDWLYTNKIRGPSAMFANAFMSWNATKTDPNRQWSYMGELQDDLVNGLRAQYWRRCRGKQAIDYYFTVDSHEDAFGFDNLKQVPLRIVFGESEEEPDVFPQTYDIVQFQPFISDLNLLNLPSGIGCVRLLSDDDIPKIPDFTGKNVFTFADASYVSTDDTHLYNYVNGFLYAEDRRIEHLAYFYTPFGSVQNKEQSPDGFMHVVYDTKHHYLYKMDLTRDKCEIIRTNSYKPQFYLPENGGTIDITDNLLLGDNIEYSYVTDTVDRNYKVQAFETTSKKFNLRNRTIDRVVTTHKHLTEDITMDSEQIVKNPPTSFELKFYGAEDTVAKEVLTINLYGYSTSVPGGNYIFGVESCFRNDDDYLFASFGFPADPPVLKKLQNEVPSIQSNIMALLLMNSELNELRVPHIFVDFSDMLYVTVMILDKPTVLLDYLPAEDKKTISNTEDMEGIQTMESCATKCLDRDTCWGFSICGATCFFGSADRAKVESNDACQLYRRLDNYTVIPSKEKAAESLRYLVEGEGFKLYLPIPGDATAEPISLKATYFEISNPGESEGVFSLIGKETNPRLRIMKAGAKLTKTGDNIRNFGKLRYEECQRLCLDYQQCETVSYCVKDSQCILSKMYGDEIPKENIVADNFCNLLARKYADNFERSGGNTMAGHTDKILQLKSPEECARACLQEKSFNCMSFDVCPAYPDSCLLSKTHKLDLKSSTEMRNDIGCGHYSKKFSFTFKREDSKRSVGVGFIAATNTSLEQCAKMCQEYGGGFCYGFDFCEDVTLTSSSCIILNDNPGKFSTASSPICNHFLQASVPADNNISNSQATWVGIVCFLVAAVVGVALTFGIAYCRANRQVK